jgi:hypothetical protein
MNLGVALEAWGAGKRDGKLDEAVASYREALKEWTPETTSYWLERAQRNVRGLALLKQRHKQKCITQGFCNRRH